MSNIFGLEALSAIAVAGSQVPGIEVGTGVIPTYPRHPALLAQQALTSALAIGPGRLTLGIGLSHQIVIESMYGYSFDKPARHMREYLSVLLPLLDGTAVSMDGETVHAHIGLSTPRPPGSPSWSPRWRRNAGARRGEGRRHHFVDDRAETVRDYVVPSITAAASAAGRAGAEGGVHAAGLRDRRCGGGQGRRRRGIRDLRPAAVLPGDARQGRSGRAGRRCHRRGRGRCRGADCGGRRSRGTDFVAYEYAHGAERQRTRAC